jgi:hypothetical protein
VTLIGNLRVARSARSGRVMIDRCTAGGSAPMSDDLWSKPDGGGTSRRAASSSPLSEIPSPQGGPTLPWYRSRIKEEDSERARRDARFVTFGALGGLSLGALTATVLAVTVPEMMGRPWIETLVVLTGVIAGILIGLMPGLRFHAGKLK